MYFNLRFGPLRDVLETIILALIVFLLAREAMQNFHVDGSSMVPSLRDDQFVLVNKTAYWRLDVGPFDFLVPGKDNGDFLFGAPDRGDVIVFSPPMDPSRDFVKRVMGIPGDTVEVRDGLVFVNGQALQESAYTAAPPSYQWGPVSVLPEYYFVLGDNRNFSNDSHDFGQVRISRIVGKVLFRWLPLDDIGTPGSRDLITLDGTNLP